VTERALVEAIRAARRDGARVVVEGFHALKHALRFGARIELAVSPEPAAVEALAARLAPELRGAFTDLVTPCTAAEFAGLAPVPPETGVLAVAARPTVDTAALGARPDRPLVLLDSPRHLGNLGAAIRVAAAADAAGVMVVGDADPWHPTAVRGAAGLQFALPCLRLAEWPPLGRPLVGLDADGEPLAAAQPASGSAFAFGSERHGLGASLRARADRLVALPMRAGVSSLNLATAVAATLYTVAPPATPRGDA